MAKSSEVAIAVLTSVALLAPGSALAGWVELGTPEGALGAGASWANEDGVYVAWADGSDSMGLWKCDGTGMAWQHLGLDICGPQAVSGLGPHRLLAVCASAELAAPAYCSLDGGIHWIEAGQGVTETPIVARLQESGYSFLVAGRANVEPLRIYRSDDMGLSWTLCFDVPSPGDMNWRSLAIDPGDPRRAYAVGSLACAIPFFETTDGGDSWEQSPGPGATDHVYFSRLLTSPLRPGELFILAANSIFERTGEGWREKALPWVQTWDLGLLSPWDLDVIYIGGLHPDPLGPVFMKSTDFGETWVDMSDGLPNRLTNHFENADLHAVGTDALYLVHPDSYAARWDYPVDVELDEDLAWKVQVVPNPSQGAVEFFVLGSEASWLGESERGGFQISDVQGRRVASIRPVSQDEGQVRYVWDGADSRGRPVGAGVYFAKPEGAPGTGIRFVRSW